MSSIRVFLGLLLIALIQFSTASPLVQSNKKVPKPNCPTPTIPPSGATPDLPSTTLKLAHVAIGRGVQNYTCAAPSASAVSIGAVATLYDATALTYANENMVHTIPPLAVYAPLPAGNLNSAATSLKPLGHHYFITGNIPVFELSAVGKILYGNKTATALAPATANKGPAGTGAVAWLELAARGGMTSVGAQLVYRVVTAGGVATPCTKAGVISVEYAAEYWFYN